jgi:peptidoglycan biosynthesis protein MviN/MurJ (putative lipid II flippase)
LMKILVLAVSIDLIPATFFYSFLARGKMKLATRIPLVAATVKCIGSLIACLAGNLQALLLSTVLGGFTFLLLMFFTTSREIKEPFHNLLRPILPPVMGGLVAWGVVDFFSPPGSVIGLLCHLTIFLIVAYAAASLFYRLLSPTVYSALRSIVVSAFTGTGAIVTDNVSDRSGV